MSIRYAHVVAFVRDHAWAILPSTMDTLCEIVSRRVGGVTLSRDELDEQLAMAAAANGPRTGAQSAGSIAVIPLYGIICQRVSMMSDMSGGAPLDRFGAAFSQALNSPEVKGIVIDVDSPGGTVDGVPEMAAQIRAARGTKPIVAVADTMCASAAYWLACQADEVMVSPSGQVGSIGLFTVHEDFSVADEQAGVKTTLISAGKFKTERNEFEPLSEEALAHVQADVDDFYSLFVADVAKGRGVSVSAVTDGYGEGLALPAKRAVAAGLADRIGTLDQAIARVASGKVQSRMAAGASGYRLVAIDFDPQRAAREDAPVIAAAIAGQLAEAEAMLAATPADEPAGPMPKEAPPVKGEADWARLRAAIDERASR
jgi:signal peptide peptidase SppA